MPANGELSAGAEQMLHLRTKAVQMSARTSNARDSIEELFQREVCTTAVPAQFCLRQHQTMSQMIHNVHVARAALH